MFFLNFDTYMYGVAGFWGLQPHVRTQNHGKSPPPPQLLLYYSKLLGRYVAMWV